MRMESLCVVIAKENFDIYSELESELRYSIILDGFLLSIDELLVSNDTNYIFMHDNNENFDILKKDLRPISKKSDNYKVFLLKLVYPLMNYFFGLYKIQTLNIAKII